MPIAWFDVLATLAVAPGRALRMQALAERVVLSFSRVSRLVSEMEGAGLVGREPDPDDGRGSWCG